MHSGTHALVIAAFCLHPVHWKGRVQASSISSKCAPPLVTIASTPVESSAGVRRAGVDVQGVLECALNQSQQATQSPRSFQGAASML